MKWALIFGLVGKIEGKGVMAFYKVDPFLKITATF